MRNLEIEDQWGLVYGGLSGEEWQSGGRIMVQFELQSTEGYPINALVGGIRMALTTDIGSSVDIRSRVVREPILDSIIDWLRKLCNRSVA